MAVQLDRDLVAAGGDLFLIPLAGGFEETSFRGYDVVDGTVILRRAQFAVAWRVVVQNLDFHSLICGVAFIGRADPDAVVGSLFQFEFETEDEVGVFFFGEEIAAAIGRTFEQAVLDDVAAAFGLDELPAGQVLPLNSVVKLTGDAASRMPAANPMTAQIVLDIDFTPLDYPLFVNRLAAIMAVRVEIRADSALRGLCRGRYR